MHRTGQFEVAAFHNPFERAREVREFPEGLSVIDIIKEAEIDTRMYLHLQVTISFGSRSSTVPMTSWAKVRPRSGAHVQISPVMHAPVLAPLLTAVVTAAAPLVTSALFPTLAVGSFGFALATAAVSVVGALLVRAIVPPPKQPSVATEDDPVFTLTGASNNAKPYEAYPTVLGRHIMFPTKTATGYTETVNDEIYLRERMTFGYGPVSLSDIKIGTTPITEFEDVEIEFLNVDQTRTLANIPDLTGGNVTVIGWRQGTQAMTLYPDDISEDNYSVLLEHNEGVVRQTRSFARSAQVDVSFQGLVSFNDDGGKDNFTVNVKIEYREVGDASWTTHETLSCVENTTAHVRFTSVINFPSEGTYDIRVTRTTDDTDDGKIRDKGNLTAIRTIQSGNLPSHSDIAEIAVRLKASNELNGKISSLNAIVQQLAPVWNGSVWSSNQPVRHPAWLFARALMGNQLRDNLADTRLDLTALKAWADEEPHWTCDMVLDKTQRLSEVLDLICATGRAKRGMNDLKYSIIRDGGAGGVVQHFTPRNSWNFSGKRFLDREIHAFRVRVISERKDWATDEILVYADGYNSGNATEIETLSLPGVVLPVDGDDQGNAYRLARYHLAVAKLRPEEFSFYSELDHIPCQLGDKIRIVHDVPSFGVGYGRVKSATADQITIDEWNHVADSSGPYRLRIRKSNGNEIVVNGDHSSEGVWDLATTLTDIPAADDLVMIEETTSEAVDLLVTSIQHVDDFKARITGLPAAPDVLTADTGTIPDYDPQITRNGAKKLSAPEIVRVFSGSAALLNSRPRIAVEVKNPSYANTIVTRHQIRWRASGASSWSYASEDRRGQIIYTDDLTAGVGYEVQVRGVSILGEPTGWTAIPALEYASYSDDAPFDVPNFKVSVLNGVATFTWKSVDPEPVTFDIRYSPVSGTWDEAVNVETNIAGQTQSISLPALNGYYSIKAVSQQGIQSVNATTAYVGTAEAQERNVVLNQDFHPSFNGDLSDCFLIKSNKLVSISTDVWEDWGTWGSITTWSRLGGYSTTKTFTFDDVVDAGSVHRAQIIVRMRAAGVRSDQKWEDWGTWENWGVWNPVSNGEWGVRVEVRTTDDDPNSGSPTWSDWSEFQIGEYEARGYQFRLQFDHQNTSVYIEVSEFEVEIDVKDRIISEGNVTCPAGGVAITFDNAFLARPHVTVNGEDLPQGVIPKTTLVSATGFTQQFIDSSGTGVACTFDYIAKGYGYA